MLVASGLCDRVCDRQYGTKSATKITELSGKNRTNKNNRSNKTERHNRQTEATTENKKVLSADTSQFYYSDKSTTPTENVTPKHHLEAYMHFDSISIWPRQERFTLKNDAA